MVELIISSQALDEQTSELIAVGFFQDERPLRSEARLIDSRMGGMVSSRLREGFMTGRAGEITLIPANGRFRADKILFVGLGERGAFCYGRFREMAGQVIKTCLGLQVYDLIITFPDPLEFGLEWARLTEAMVEGLNLGLEAGKPPSDIRIRVPNGAEYYDQILRGVSAVRRILKKPVPVKVLRDPSS